MGGVPAPIAAPFDQDATIPGDGLDDGRDPAQVGPEPGTGRLRGDRAGRECGIAGQRLAGDGRAKIVLFIAPPFCPHNAISEDSKAYRALKETFFEPEYVLKKYFPYLSDSSYISVDETPEELERMKDDFPLEDFLYPLPYETMRKLSIPAVDLGVFGKGAHTFKERVYKPYSYGILPEKIRTYTKLMWK